MNQYTVEQATSKLINEGIASLDVVIGCSEGEIKEIERKYEIKLPLIYRQFLGSMGKVAGDFLAGTDYQFPVLLELREQAISLLDESNANLSLDKNDFVFLVHQGYQFMFFKTRSSKDPAVFLYEENKQEFKKVYNHFSEWLLASVKDEIALFKELRKE